MSSTNYGAEGTVGEVAGEQTSTNYKANSGLVFVQNANVPTVTLTNGGSWYNKLLVTIGPENNASDTTYAIAISDDNFTTTNYVKPDGTLDSSLQASDYQSYTSWGGSSGTTIVGLNRNTTYKVKVKAIQGRYTESAYSPVVSASTADLILSFDLDVAPTDSESGPPYAVGFGDLSAGAVSTASDKVWVDFATNGENGGSIYVYDAYAGLKSSAVNYTISSASTNLTSASEGFGLQVASVSNLTAESPYDGSSENVGAVDTTIRTIFDSGGAPVTSGRGSFVLKAKSATETPAANDYTDTLTLISSAAF